MRTWFVVAIASGASFGCGDLASDTDASADAASDVSDPNACAPCEGTLESLCSPADGGMVCPPPLDSPSLYAWVQSHIVPVSFRAPSCIASSACPDLIMLVFGDGVDCGHEFLFDVTTKKLVAVTDTCDGFALASCRAASPCLPNRCMPDRAPSLIDSPACPALPDSGLLDAADQ